MNLTIVSLNNGSGTITDVDIGNMPVRHTLFGVDVRNTSGPIDIERVTTARPSNAPAAARERRHRALAGHHPRRARDLRHVLDARPCRHRRGVVGHPVAGAAQLRSRIPPSTAPARSRPRWRAARRRSRPASAPRIPAAIIRDSQVIGATFSNATGNVHFFSINGRLATCCWRTARRSRHLAHYQAPARRQRVRTARAVQGGTWTTTSNSGGRRGRHVRLGMNFFERGQLRRHDVNRRPAARRLDAARDRGGWPARAAWSSARGGCSCAPPPPPTRPRRSAFDNSDLQL